MTHEVEKQKYTKESTGTDRHCSVTCSCKSLYACLLCSVALTLLSTATAHRQLLQTSTEEGTIAIRGTLHALYCACPVLCMPCTVQSVTAKALPRVHVCRQRPVH